MVQIRKANKTDYDAVRVFYYAVTDELADAQYGPGWEKDIYPCQEFLIRSIKKGELYIGEQEEQMVSCMVVNHESNDGYRKVHWSLEAADEDILVIHALGVRAAFSGRGIAKEMVRYVIAFAENSGIRTIRLDVLDGNLPAEKAYTKLGFRYLETVPMFYEDTGWTDYRLFEYILAC